MAKPFGKSGFGEVQKGSYYFKELQAGRISKKLELIKSKLGDIKKIVDYIKFRAKKDGISIEVYKKKLNGK